MEACLSQPKNGAKQMPIEVHISNRQRRIDIDAEWLSEMGGQLTAGLVKNLTTKPPKWLNKGIISQIGQRGELSLSVVSNAQIKKINKQWRGKNSATDVLSFPLQEASELEAPPQPIPFELGEIIISAERAWEQAEEFGHSFEREFAFLFIHGCLHILGFDHEVPADEKLMFSRQKEILTDCGYPRR
jgi:probable rRNA maturation factor